MPLINTTYYDAPFGRLILGEYEGRLCLCDFAYQLKHNELTHKRLSRVLNADYVLRETPVLKHSIRQLNEYFAGKRTSFEIPLLQTGTELQLKVREALQQIPYGNIVSYSEIATEIGHPKSVRAVANAIGANTLSIFVPCHRVIGKDGKLTGYAGGLEAKRLLLRLESAILK